MFLSRLYRKTRKYYFAKYWLFHDKAVFTFTVVSLELEQSFSYLFKIFVDVEVLDLVL